MRIAVAQLVSSTEPPDNLELIRDHAVRARDEGAALVVFPEATMASFATASRKVAEPEDGPWASSVREIAREVGIAMVVGMFQTSDDERAYNCVLVTGPGVEETSYRKLHLYDAWGFKESEHIAPGEEPATFTLSGMTFGIAICYDVRFPALFQHYGNVGADVVLVPTSWAGGPGKAEQFTTLCTARAMDSTCYVVAAAQADPATVGREVKPGSPTGVGHSIVVDPVGTVVKRAGAEPELLIVEVDPARVRKAREQVPVLTNARFTATLDC